MALDTKLKSEMTGGPNSTTGTSRNTSGPEQPAASTSFGTNDGQTPVEEHEPPAKAIPHFSEPSTSSGTVEALLQSIEKQLKSLNQSVADLEQEVNSCKTPDYRAVFSKIDSARCSIEKMLSGVESPTGSSEKSILDKIAQLEAIMNGVADKQDRNDRQLAQTLRENANFQIQVRQGMQRDIDALREQQNGEQFNPILKEIASMYVEYQGLLEDESISGLSRKNLAALFEQMEDLLFDNDAEISRTEVGETRQTKSTKIIGKIPTGEQEKHNTVAASRKPGVLRGRTVLYPEFVDVYVFDPSLAPGEDIAADEEIAAETPLDESDKTVESESGMSDPVGDTAGESTSPEEGESTESGESDQTEDSEPADQQIE